MHEGDRTGPSLRKKFDIFHERHVWKSPRLNKRCSSQKHSVITATHPEQDTHVMRKAICESVYSRRGRQADPKETASRISDCAYPHNLIQRFQRELRRLRAKTTRISPRRGGGLRHSFVSARLRSPLWIN
jgi:hypothetical protein